MDEIVGHERAVGLLRRAQTLGPLHHAYLITGPSGVGKSTLARAFARTLNCTRQGEPCRVGGENGALCRSCRLILRGLHPDVRTIELEADRSKISFKDIEALQADASLRAMEARYKVYLILDAERLSATAANQLLKTLEEPPVGVMLVLTAQEGEALLPTIVSRCQQIRLARVPMEAIAALLEARHGLERSRAQELAALAQGRVGVAIQLATQDEVARRIQEAESLLFNAVRGGRLERLEIARGLADRWSGPTGPVLETLRVWIELLRDALRLTFGQEGRVVHRARVAALRELGARLGRARLASGMEVLGRALQDLDANANPRLALDVALLSLPREARAT